MALGLEKASPLPLQPIGDLSEAFSVKFSKQILKN
jgi:hypothetical protein